MLDSFKIVHPAHYFIRCNKKRKFTAAIRLSIDSCVPPLLSSHDPPDHQILSVDVGIVPCRLSLNRCAHSHFTDFTHASDYKYSSNRAQKYTYITIAIEAYFYYVPIEAKDVGTNKHNASFIHHS